MYFLRLETRVFISNDLVLIVQVQAIAIKIQYFDLFIIYHEIFTSRDGVLCPKSFTEKCNKEDKTIYTFVYRKLLQAFVR